MLIDWVEIRVWVFLVIATALSCWLGLAHLGASARLFALIDILVILIAFVKVRFVLLYYMELRWSPPLWRGIVEAGLIAVFSLLAVLYLC